MKSYLVNDGLLSPPDETASSASSLSSSDCFHLRSQHNFEVFTPPASPPAIVSATSAHLQPFRATSAINKGFQRQQNRPPRQQTAESSCRRNFRNQRPVTLLDTPTPFSNSPSGHCSDGDDQLQGSTGLSGRYKTELCRPFTENGECKYGDKCQFAHGMHELKSMTRHPKYKTEFCRTFHTIGFCPYGPRCHFLHAVDSPADYEQLRSGAATSALMTIQQQLQQRHNNNMNNNNNNNHNFPPTPNSSHVSSCPSRSSSTSIDSTSSTPSTPARSSCGDEANRLSIFITFTAAV